MCRQVSLYAVAKKIREKKVRCRFETGRGQGGSGLKGPAEGKPHLLHLRTVRFLVEKGEVAHDIPTEEGSCQARKTIISHLGGVKRGKI